MIPLAACSFIVLLVIIERLLVLRSGRLISLKAMSAWDTWFSNDLAEDKKPKSISSSVPASILNSMVDYFPLSRSRLEERITDLGRMEKHKLERGLVFLDTIAGIAPLFGLLGTALGMVEVFSRLSVAGEAKMSALSSGISQALFTTVTGLCIGIPALIAFNLFSRHIEKILIKTEDQINCFIDRHAAKIIEE